MDMPKFKVGDEVVICSPNKNVDGNKHVVIEVLDISHAQKRRAIETGTMISSYRNIKGNNYMCVLDGLKYIPMFSTHNVETCMIGEIFLRLIHKPATRSFHEIMENPGLPITV